MRWLPKIRLKQLLLLSAITAGLLVALAIAVQPWQQQWMADHLRGRITELPEEDAVAAVRQAAELGEPGLEVVAEALGSYRAQVAREAERILLAETDLLKRLPTSQASPRAAALAQALARSVPSYGPTARDLAFRMIERMLRVPVDVALIDNAAYLADCKQVVQAAGRSSGKPETLARAADSLDTSPVPDASTPPVGENPTAELFKNSELPGGGLPIEPAGVPRLPTGLADEFPGQKSPPEGATPKTQEPDLIAAPQGAQPTSPNDLIELPAPPPERFMKPPRAQRIPLREETTSEARRTSSTKLETLQEMEILPLMRELHNPSLEVAAAVAAELRNRGLLSVHLQHARALTGKDVKARLDLVDSLPGSIGIDVGQWLLWLARDRDARVRLAALSVLLTSNDPKLLQQAREMARQDSDSRVVALGQRSSKGSRLR